MLALLYALLMGPVFSADRIPTPEEYGATLRPVLDSIQSRDFISSADGARVAYALIPGVRPEQDAIPIVVVVGKGESRYRYLDMIQRLRNQGLGPFLILEHRGQGFSERPLPNQPSVAHVKDFNLYVDDLIQFMDGPVKKELGALGIKTKPQILAHSMGGTVADLALLKRPDLTHRIGYLSPMFDILAPNAILNFHHDAPMKVVADFLCFVGCGTMPIPAGAEVLDPNRAMSNLRLQWSKDRERELGIAMHGATPQWIRQSVRATDTVRARAGERSTRTLIVEGVRDETIGNVALFDYACKAHDCSLIQVAGGHAVHQAEDDEMSFLADQLTHFYKTGEPLPRGMIYCPHLFRILL